MHTKLLHSQLELWGLLFLVRFFPFCFSTNHKGSHILSAWFVHARFVFVAQGCKSSAFYFSLHFSLNLKRNLLFPLPTCDTHDLSWAIDECGCTKWNTGLVLDWTHKLNIDVPNKMVTNWRWEWCDHGVNQSQVMYMPSCASVRTCLGFDLWQLTGWAAMKRRRELVMEVIEWWG